MLSKVTITIALLAACLAVAFANEEVSGAFQGAEEQQLAVETEITSPRAEVAPHRDDADRRASPSAADPESGDDKKSHVASKKPSPLPSSDEAASSDDAHATCAAQCQSKMAEKDRKNAELQAIIAEKDRKMAELSQQLQASKELGDEAGWFNRGAGEDHQQDTGATAIHMLPGTCTSKSSWSDKECRTKCSDPAECNDKCGNKCSSECACNSGGKSCTNAAKCNPAKCYGETQDNRVLHGDLDCETSPFNGKDRNKGSACLDNLSGGAFYTSSVEGNGDCVGFGSEKAFARTTRYDYTGGVRDGTITKLLSAHPHKTPKKIGVISAKRMKCEGNTCHVFKTGYCIKCPRNVFQSENEQAATQEDINKFYSCCVMGGANYTKDGGTVKDCHEDFRTTGITDPVRPPGAFNATNDASAALKPEYECNAASQAAAEATMKAS